MWRGPGANPRAHKLAGLRRQGGVVMLLYVAAALTMIGMAGLALDLGTIYTTKTRLQTAADAAALDGALTLTYGSVALAKTNATSTFTTNASAVSGAVAALVVETSASYTPSSPFTFTNGTIPAKFVKVSVSNVSVRTYLVNVFTNTNSMSVSASAVAGPQNVSACGAPIGICGDKTNPDHDCTDGSCWGIPTVGGEVHLKSPPSGSGFFGLLDAGHGASDINQALAGAQSMCLQAGDTPPTEGGFVGSNTDALNTRFGTANGTYNDPAKYPPDVITALPDISLTYAVYSARLASGVYDTPSGKPKRRTFPVPILDCSAFSHPGDPVPVLGSTCFFMTREVPTSGVNRGDVYGQMIDTCLSNGGTPGGSGGGAQRIVLYQSSAAG